ncbi:MAG: glutathione peroxidase, partial [Ramlibacter sp.]|nr:glutathione peroxidase [Ramlibacter sp.]
MPYTVRLLALAAALGALAGAPAAHAAAGAPACPATLDHVFPRLQDEKPQSLCQYSGKVLLVVNTASYCGFTPQYAGLEAL